MATLEIGQQNCAANSLSPGNDCGLHSLTNFQDEGRIVKDGPPAVDAATLESLMQEQEADTTAVTVDEVATNPPPQHHPTSPIHVQGQLLLPPHVIPAQPPQHLPLQLVYLQPTPHGVNIIPIQAAGQPSFTPYSPPGFPALPHHPVVVQPGLPFPLQHPSFYPSHPVYTPSSYPTYPQHYQGQVLHHPAGTGAHIFPQNTSTMVAIPAYRQQFFRPWEDVSHTSDQSVLCPHTDCGGEGGQHSQLPSGEGFQHFQSGGEDQQLPPYSEEDFPALTKELSRIKIKK